MPSFIRDGVEIAFLDEGEGEPIVLIHGFASNKEVNWVGPGWVSALTRAGRRVIALDNRGHGQSSKLYDPAAYHSSIMAEDVRALHILTQDSMITELTTMWDDLVGEPARAAGLAVPQLVLRRSTYRQFFAPLVRYVEQLRDRHPDRDLIVIVPDLVVRHWYHRFLHNNRGTVLRSLLRLRGGPRVVVVNTPFYLED